MAESKTWTRIYGVIFFTAVTALIGSFALAYYGFAHPHGVTLKDHDMNQWATYRQWEVVVLAVWVVVPPLFFWVEYFGIYRKNHGYKSGDNQPDDWEMFKYAQDLSSKVWLAVVTALLVLYFGKDIKM